MRHGLRRDKESPSAGSRLESFIDPEHPLAKLSAAIDWHLFEGRLRPFQGESLQGGPTQARAVVGMAVLRQLYDLSEETLCQRWLENPYFQLFCGERFFQHSLPYNRTSLLSSVRRLSGDSLNTLVRLALSRNIGIELSKLPELTRLGISVETLLKPAAGRAAAKEQNGDRPVSIYHVAKHAGVSIKTVSLVINRQPNVSLHTRTAVLAAIDALSYKPNVFARGLAREQSFLIGLLHDPWPGYYIADLELGALARCREAGYHLIVELMSPQQDPEISQRVRALVSESVLHGVILTPPLCDEAVIMEELTRTRTPFVRIAPGTPMPGLPAVRIDEFKAAFEMTEHLIGLGHRRIAFVKGKPDHAAALTRFDGYRKALKQAGISVSEELCAQGSFTYKSGLEAGERLLSLKDRPTAIFAANDEMAAGVLAASRRLNLKIPHDLSLTGFDDSVVSQMVWPRLTTCRQPIREMAAAAVSILTQKKREPDEPHVRVLAHELVVRESTAAPPF